MQYNSTGAAAGYIFVCKYYSMRELKEGRDDKAKEMARKSDERESTEHVREADRCQVSVRDSESAPTAPAW
jgi:bifunctional DNA-binding transcriptional regulator/antitoxin component of YhaV-PrlF toxin-antitoxin module